MAEPISLFHNKEDFICLSSSDTERVTGLLIGPTVYHAKNMKLYVNDYKLLNLYPATSALYKVLRLSEKESLFFHEKMGMTRKEAERCIEGLWYSSRYRVCASH